MRLSLALLPVWSSTSGRRHSFVNGFVGLSRYKRDTISHIALTTGRGQWAMEADRPKRPRKGNPNAISMSTLNSNDEMGGRSPYERKMGKRISLCSKCLGEGKVRAPLSKKERARRKRMQQSSEGSRRVATLNDPPIQPQMKACPACDGSGLVAASASDSSIENEDSSNKNGKNRRTIPKVSPGVSVAIVGGGIGGMALAAALQHRNIPCVVYERDLSFEERKQGYGLTMQQGARALRSLGFFSFSDGNEGEGNAPTDIGGAPGSETKEDGVPRARFGIHSTRHVVHTPDGTTVGEWGMKVWGGRFERNNRKHAKRQNAHISRQGLRRLLMGMLRPGTIRWGHGLVGYSGGSGELDGDGGGDTNLTLTFRRRRPECEGTNEECEDVVTADTTILVGCDGIRSAVRANKLGDVAPLRYLDCIVVLGIAASPDSALTDGETVFQTADGITRLYAMPFARAGEEASSIGILNGDHGNRGLSMWQLSFPMDEADAKRLSKLGPSALKAEALKRCGPWHDPIPALLSQTPEDLITGYPCYDRALVGKQIFREGYNTESSTGDAFVTMLGDAAHPMSPFKGQGANQALLDAVLLARKLYSKIRIDDRNPEDRGSVKSRIPAALAEFEEEMLGRSAVKVKKSADAARFLHTHVAISEGNVTRGAAAAEDGSG